MDWRKIVGTVAPAIGTALGGPLGGIAVAAVSDALLGKPNGTEGEIATALQVGGTEALLKLKAADQTFALEMERVQQADRASAREREGKTGDSITPRLLALFLTAGFFAALGYLLVAGKPAVGGDALLVMLGALGGAFGAVVNYYFGSSSGSAQYRDLLARKA